MSASTAQPPRLILLMGVAGSGKTTLGRLLARRLGYVFLDADDFHGAKAIARMRAGQPLGDELRDAWVERLAARLIELQRAGQDCVLAFSGLRARHRKRLTTLGFETSAFMLRGTAPLLQQRLEERAGHFMPGSQLQDQLTSMELIENDERVELVETSAAPDAIVAALAARFGA